MFKDNILKVTFSGLLAACMFALVGCAEHPQSNKTQPLIEDPKPKEDNGSNLGNGSEAIKIFSISPTSGPNSGGTEIEITGSHFTDGLTIKIGVAPCGSIHVHSPSMVTCITPEHWGYRLRRTTPYSAFITISSSNGSSASLLDAFTYLPDESHSRDDESHSRDHGREQNRNNGRQDPGATQAPSIQEKFQLAKTQLCSALEIADVLSATEPQIQSAFRRKSRAMHPDKNPHRWAEATVEFQVLSNLRDEYVRLRALHGADW